MNLARMYARKRGSSGSTRPLRTTAPNWIRHSAKEVELLVVKLRREGMDPSKIGLTLRDSYGIPSVKIITGKKITQVLKEHKMPLALPEDLSNLIKKAIRVHKHLGPNRKDLHSKRGLQLNEAKIRRMVKYYKRQGILPAEWKYTADKAALLVE